MNHLVASDLDLYAGHKTAALRVNTCVLFLITALQKVRANTMVMLIILSVFIVSASQGRVEDVGLRDLHRPG